VTAARSIHVNLDLPPLVQQKLRQLGVAGQRWLAELPALVDELAQAWSLELGATLQGGTAAYVARARTADGTDAVLKIVIPDPDHALQVRTLVEARGQGYARVLAHAEDRRAILIEALGPSLEDLHWTPERSLEVLCQTLREAWQVEPWPALRAAGPFPKARQLHELVRRLWEQLGQPCSERIIALALAYAEQRTLAEAPEHCVVVHGDPHPGNTLQLLAPRANAPSGFVLIDPDGFLAEKAYDLGVVLRDFCAELASGDARALAERYCRLLSSYTGVDYEAIWQWGFLERVSSGLYMMHCGAEQEGRLFLSTAERLLS